MMIIENLVLLSVFLTYPLAIYLIYIAYMNNMDLKEKKLILDFTLLSSLFLMAKFINNRSLYSILFYNIPLLISYLRKKNNTSIILSLIIIYFTYKYTKIPLFISILEYSIYYIGYLLILKTKNKETNIINYFISLKSFLISFLIFFFN